MIARKIFPALTCVFILCSCFLNGQDTLLLKNGDEIKSKVLEITLTEIKYKKFDNPDGPLISILKNDVFLIKYQNGTKDVYNLQTENVSSFGTAEEMFTKGQADAVVYYGDYKNAATGTLATTILYPPAGLVSAIAFSTTKPKEVNLGYPNHELFKNPDYQNGYYNRAHKIKSGKVWSNFGYGVGIDALILLIIIASVFNNF